MMNRIFLFMFRQTIVPTSSLLRTESNAGFQTEFPMQRFGFKRWKDDYYVGERVGL